MSSPPKHGVAARPALGGKPFDGPAVLKRSQPESSDPKPFDGPAVLKRSQPESSDPPASKAAATSSQGTSAQASVSNIPPPEPLEPLPGIREMIGSVPGPPPFGRGASSLQYRSPHDPAQAAPAPAPARDMPSPPVPSFISNTDASAFIAAASAAAAANNAKTGGPMPSALISGPPPSSALDAFVQRPPGAPGVAAATAPGPPLTTGPLPASSPAVFHARQDAKASTMSHWPAPGRPVPAPRKESATQGYFHLQRGPKQVTFHMRDGDMEPRASYTTTASMRLLKSAIDDAVERLTDAGSNPTLDRIHSFLRANQPGYTISRATLHRRMKVLGYDRGGSSNPQP